MSSRAQVWASLALFPLESLYSRFFPLDPASPHLYFLPGPLRFGLTLLGSIRPGCKVVIKEALKEIWKENEGGFMMLGREFCCWLGAV